MSKNMKRVGRALDDDTRAEIAGLRIALFMCAAHCQGGHSEAGRRAAEALGVPFPIRMESLKRAARRDGYDPARLWPWLTEMERGSALAEMERGRA